MKLALTQAEIVRRVKAVVAGYRAAGVNVTGGRVSFHNGEVTVEVTTESLPPPPVATGGMDVEALKERMQGCHARRS